MGTGDAKITVVTVCYNAASLLKETIESVLSQTYPNVEYIIVDGASRDGTVEMVKSYGDRIAHFVSEKDSGIYDAMNKGIDMATGEWVLFMNAGDTFFGPETVSSIFAGKDYRADVVFGDALNRYKWGYVFAEGRPFTGKARRLPFCHQSTFVRRSVLACHKFDLSFKVSADHNQLYGLYRDGYVFEHVHVIVAIYDTTGVSGYSVKSFKDVSRVNGDDKITYYKRLLRVRARVLLSKILPEGVLDAYRRRKYRKSGLIYNAGQLEDR